MFIIKHKSRRRTGRAHTKNAAFYFVIYAGANDETNIASYSTDDVNDAGEAMNEALQYGYRFAPVALTLWDVYKWSRAGAYQSI